MKPTILLIFCAITAYAQPGALRGRSILPGMGGVSVTSGSTVKGPVSVGGGVIIGLLWIPSMLYNTEGGTNVMTVEQIARVVHESERGYSRVVLQEEPQPIWAESGEVHRRAVMEHVHYALRCPEASPREMYNEWHKGHKGDFHRLAPEEQSKYTLFGGVVRALGERVVR